MATCIYLHLLLILHAAVATLPLPSGVLAVAPKISLAGKSFSLSAALDISTTGQQQHAWHYQLEELHSGWQLRSKVRYIFSGPRHDDADDDNELLGGLPAQVRQSGTFFADHEQLLVVNEEVRFCEAPAGAAKLLEQLLTDGLLEGFAYQKHLIGSSRLLFFVDANRDKFERKDSSSMQLNDPSQVVTEYTGTLQVAGVTFEVTLLYSEQELAGQMWAGIPRSITIQRSSSGNQRPSRMLKFTFQRFHELKPAGFPLFGPLEATSSQQHGAGVIAGADLDKRGQALAFDLFALERSIGCSHALTTFLPEALDMTRAEPRGFTLTARVDLQMVAAPVHLTVGYEPALYTLKVRKAGPTRTTELLTNFRQNRCYHSTSRRAGTAAGSDAILDSILKMGQTGEDVIDSTCVVTRASPRNEEASQDPSTRYMSRRESAVSPHTQGQLLLGADRLVYMGMARVRGIEANVYESYDSQLPVWLQAPSVYEALSGGNDKLHWRVNSPDGDKAPVLLTSVFYFSRIGRSSDNLLLVEIFKSPRPGLDKGGAAAIAMRKDKITIPIYDFVWRENGHAQALAPDGMRLEDFYSLGGDQCLAAASRAQNQYARLDLLLESLVGSRDDGRASQLAEWMREPSKRNLALMRALQEQFGVPSQFVYDLESRHEVAVSGATVLPVTLRLAQRKQMRSDLHLLGRGEFRQEMRRHFRMFLAFSFQACSMIAAQLRADLSLFLFDPVRSMCFLYKGDVQQLAAGVVDDAKLLEMLVVPEQQVSTGDVVGRRSLEAYKIVQRPDMKLPASQKDGRIGRQSDPRLSGSDQTIEQLRERLASAGGLYLTDPSLEPPLVSDEEWQPAKSQFKIVKLNLDLVDQKSPAQLNDTGSGQTIESDSSKFPGFGMASVGAAEADDDPQIQEVHAKWVPGPAGGPDLPGQMTYGQCQTACLASAECRAYSTCILEGQMRCHITSANFRSSDLVAQLMMLERKPAKVGTIFALDLNGDVPDEVSSKVKRQVHVMRHPSCELHNKSYRDLFKAVARRVSLSLAGRILRPVSNQEQCARMCFTSTWEFMREQDGEFSGSTMSNHIRRKLSLEANADFSKWAREYRERICDHFLYLDLDDVKRLAGGDGGPSALSGLKAQIQGSNFEGRTRGYCLVDKPQLGGDDRATKMGEPETQAKPEADPKQQIHLELAQQFDFNFLMLYEATEGLTLEESPKSELEKAAYHSVSYGRAAATPEELRAITMFVDRGDNSGQARPAESAAECARECFQQLTGPTPWPACRSFSFMEVWHTERGKRYSFCLYNSITLRQAHAQERFDLVRDRPETQKRICVLASEQVRIWHYDPKPGLIASSLAEVYHLGLDQSVATYFAANSKGVHVETLALFLSIMVILVVGVTLGVWLGNEYYLRKGKLVQANGRLSDSDQLVTGGAPRRPRIAKVVFENAHHRED